MEGVTNLQVFMRMITPFCSIVLLLNECLHSSIVGPFGTHLFHLFLSPPLLQGIKEGWYDGASIAFAVILVIVVTG